MYNLYFLNFNNLYNRQIKLKSTVDEYLRFLIDPYVEYNQINFNPNDGISAEQIISEWNIEQNPNYLIVEDNDSGNFTRWFVIDFERLRNGQYKAKLFRDVIADNFDVVVDSPMFIQKATVKNGNPLIFNKENMQFNQIKRKESLLKDSTNTAWIVGYYDSKFKDEATTASGSYTPIEISDDFDSLEDFYASYPEYQTIEYLESISGSVGVRASHVFPIRLQGYVFYSSYFSGTSRESYDFIISPAIKYNNANEFESELEELYSSSQSAIAQSFGFTSSNVIDRFLSRTNKTVKINGDYYKLKYDVADFRRQDSPTLTNRPEIFNTIKNYLTNNTSASGIDQANEYSFIVYVRAKKYTFYLEQTNQPLNEISINFTSNKMINLADAPYSMFAIPYTYPDIAYGAAMAIANAMQPSIGNNGFLYDLQLLPYCPIQIDLNSYSYKDAINTGTGITEYIYYCNKSSFEFIIQAPTELTEFKDHILNTFDDTKDIIEKLDSECNKYRLCSPNYSNYDEFIPAMNNGVDYFKVICTYKPYNPFINIHINYQNLYGQDFNDARGLNCGGDYSLPLMTDQWRLYEINNKNYANVFDRQIQNTELNQKWQMAETVVGSIVGVGSGAVGGAMMGAFATGGNPYGIAAGAVVGGVASAVGGGIDIAKTAILQREQLGYMRDMYAYNLQNIKALPHGLSRTSSYNINNKLYPFIEYYSCTDIEIQALIDKIKYNGMNINIIGKISDYLTYYETYIQATPIRLNNLVDDSHMASIIATILEQGIFMIQGDY